MKDLLPALALPFQLASLLFVTLTSLLLAVALLIPLPLPGSARLVLGLFVLWVVLVWLTRYAFQMIDDAANGTREAAVATAEMVNPFGDPRCWMHPALALLALILHLLAPAWPIAATLVAAALLFPPSIAATAMSGNALDAVNPRAIAQVIAGFGPWYPLVVAGVLVIVMAGWLSLHWLGLGWLTVAGLELLLLLAYALIGGAVHARRIELGFAARVSPEREAERLALARDNRRQRMIDGVYVALRGRDTARALNDVRHWFADAQPTDIPGDTREIIATGLMWNEPRGFASLMRGLAALLLERGQVAPAFAAAQAGLATEPDFAPEDALTTAALAEYGRSTGQRRTGLRLLDNFEAARPCAPPSTQLKALRASLETPRDLTSR